MPNNETIAPCGLWESDVDIDRAVDRSVTPAYPFEYHSNLYWLESLPLEQGRVALVCQRQGTIGKAVLTPSGFNIRTRVNEYGGKCFCLSESWFVFNDYSDGSLYCQNLEQSNAPELLFSSSEIPGCCGFGDLVVLPDMRVVVAVCESERADQENLNFLVAIPFPKLSDSVSSMVTRYSVLSHSADFCSSPAINRDQNKLAWLEWDHPFMPWDQTRLKLADIELRGDRLVLTNVEVVAEEDETSVFQPGFLSDDSLLYISDGPQCDYWNFFRYQQTVNQVTNDLVEYGEAQWVLGQSRWVESKNNTVLAIETSLRGERIVELDANSGERLGKSQYCASINDLNISQSGEICTVVGYVDRIPEIARFADLNAQWTLIKPASAQPDQLYRFCGPKQICFDTGNRDKAYAYFYCPQNGAMQSQSDQKPPLIVTIHGGPTARTTPEYNGLRHYFCSLGFAVLDINHRGSTGLGRTFRQSLLTHWGVFDVEDIAAGIQYVAEKNWINPDMVFIRGSSAGGYAVLRALTQYPDIFSGGACYYGIGNLVTLAEITHKFESNYTDRLIGETYSTTKSRLPESEFVKRSPIHDIDQIAAPLIVFQGTEDKVVPPTLAQEIVNGLAQRKIDHKYVEYPGEGHGFRQPENRVDSLRQETNFYRDIIRKKINTAH